MRAKTAKTVNRFLTLMTVGAFLAAAILFGAGVAKADPVDRYAMTVAPAVCQTLAEFPTFNGILGIGQGIVDDTGWGYEEAGRIITEAVYIECPRFIPLLNRFVQTYRPGGSVGTVLR